MKSKKVLAALLIGSMMVGSVTGCGKTESQETDSISQTADSDSGQQANERVSIEIVSGDSVELPPESENFVNEALSEAIGADVTFSILGTGSDYSTALNVRITGGDVPDIFAVPSDVGSSKVISKDTLYQYIQNDIVMSLEPYMKQLQPVLDFTGEPAKTDLYQGETYLVPVKMIDTVWASNMIRTDWLEAVGAQMPQTPEEMLEVCKKFAFEDPDGNGKADTYGLSGAGLKVFNTILNGYDASVANDIIIRDGKVTSTLLSPHMKDGLEMCKEYVESGAIDPDLVANSDSVTTDKAVQGVTGIVNASFAGLMRQTTQDQVAAVNSNAKWEVFNALEGPDGAYCGSRDVTNTGARYVIGKHVEDNPAKLEKIIELLNYLASEEGQRLVCYGIEGEHYNLVDGEVVPTERMASETDFIWCYQMLERDNDKYLQVKFKEWDELLPYVATIPRFEVYNGAVRAPEGFYAEDFNKYITEEMTKFIYGQRDIAEYDRFLEELESMFGFSDYMKAAEEQLREYGLVE